MWEQDIPKHRKKKKSSISSAKMKSKHKHEYVDCILIDNKFYIKAEYCKICGKIGERDWFAIFKKEDENIDKLEHIKVDSVFGCKFI